METKIPKIIFQTSREPQESYVIDKIKEKAADWEYIHFTDEEARQFMRENPLPELPNIVDRFNAMPSGPHKADLFRYYFLYIRGGVFIDSDAMIETAIDTIVKSSDFFTVISIHVPNTIFQGFIGCNPGNKIIYEALCAAYNTPNELMEKEFHILCRQLYHIIIKYMEEYNIELFIEIPYRNRCVNIIDKNGLHVLTHYCTDKIIPR
jgi:mannosyltransferase OCH1-like enzyme